MTSVKDDNEAVSHFFRRTLPIFKCFDYNKVQTEIWRQAGCAPYGGNGLKIAPCGEIAGKRILFVRRHLKLTEAYGRAQKSIVKGSQLVYNPFEIKKWEKRSLRRKGITLGDAKT